MSDDTKIEWTDHTFNPWWGCSRVSPGCRFCYADRDAQRYGHQVWRRHGPRRMLSEANWQRPLKWNRDAERTGTPEKVFCASMADVFEDHPDVAEARERLWGVIEATPWLCWQLLTKRPENVAAMAPWGDDWPESVWLGTSVEDQRRADERIPVLARIPARTRFLSCEPLLGPVEIPFTTPVDACTCGDGLPPYGHEPMCGFEPGPALDRIHWAIVGGESGPKARPMAAVWARSLVRQCAEWRVPVFVKQLGSVLGKPLGAGPKGGDMAAWPEYLRIREFPRSAEAVPHA